MNADIDVKDVINNVTKDFQDSTVDIDFTYQNEKWYTASLAVMRAVNLLLCAVLVVVFSTGGF